jgi:exopolysaccharide biosynthesis WecB/TagA/CpsF family protein
MTATLIDPQMHDAPRERGGPPKKLMRVLHLINGEHYAGAEKVQDLLAASLADYGFDAAFGCVKPDQFSKMRKSDVPLYEFAMRSRFDLHSAKQIARLIEEENFELLHTHTPRTALVGHVAAKRAGVPLVHHVHGQTASEMKRLAGWTNALSERVSLRNADRLIAVSDSLRRYLLRQGFADERISVVYNGVPSPAELPDRAPPCGEWTIGTVALFRPRKGLETLLLAIAQLRRDGIDARLRAVGRFETAAYESEVRRAAEQFGIQSHVDWVGFTSDVYAELAKIDLAVLPSLLAEGLPMVVIEAMAMGVPTIGTRVDGIVDVIEHEQNGLLAEPGDADSLAEQLARVISGQVDWHRLRAQAIADHENKFSACSMAGGVAEIYRDVLDAHETRGTRSKTPVAHTAKKVHLFGIDIDALHMPEAVARVQNWIDQSDGTCRYVVTPNVQHAVMFQKNKELQSAYRDAGLVLADGMPVVLASRLLGRRLPERVTGSDLVPALFSGADAGNELRVFLLGAAPGVADRAAANIQRQWPNVAVVGTYSPPLGFERDEDENRRIIEMVNSAVPDVLIVGLGAPKQELWTHRHFQQINASAALCVGATIDFLAGEKRRAPRWMQKLGLEWLFRCLSEPRRLIGRYARDAWLFPRLVWSEWRGGSRKTA